MRFVIGSLNPSKRSALQAALGRQRQTAYREAEIHALYVPSGVIDQPLDLMTVLQGARNRAVGAFETMTTAIGVGIESGLFPLPMSESGWADVTTCALYDGRRTYVGISPAFEVPSDAVRHIIDDGANLSEAALRAGYTDKPYLGYQEGIVGVLTGGNITRTDYTVPAVEMALIHLVQAWKQPR